MPAGQPLKNLTPALNPRLATLLDFWQSRLGANGLVLKQDFNPFALKPWLGYMSLFEKQGDDYIIRLDGTEVVAMIGQDWTGRKVSEADAHFRLRLLESLEIMVAERRPIYHREHLISPKPFMKVGRLMMPLSADAATITHAMIAFFPNNPAHPARS